jgi:hypothetical protein
LALSALAGERDRREAPRGLSIPNVSPGFHASPIALTGFGSGRLSTNDLFSADPD